LGVFFGGGGELYGAGVTGTIRCFLLSYSLCRQKEKELHRCNDARLVYKVYNKDNGAPR
jgi:hypothetical protein